MTAQEARAYAQGELDESLNEIFKSIKESIDKKETDLYWYINEYSEDLSVRQVKRLRELGYAVEVIETDNEYQDKHYIIKWE